MSLMRNDLPITLLINREIWCAVITTAESSTAELRVVRTVAYRRPVRERAAAPAGASARPLLPATPDKVAFSY